MSDSEPFIEQNVPDYCRDSCVIKRKLVDTDIITEPRTVTCCFGKEHDENLRFSIENDPLELNSNLYRGGLLTNRLRPCSVPRLCLTRYHRIRLEQPLKLPEFAGLPGWLKPFLSQHNQMGLREDRLCAIFRHLPDDLLSELRSACTAVVVISLKRMKIAQEAASNDRCYEIDDDMESEPWLYEGSGLSDDELETYDAAEFGIVR